MPMPPATAARNRLIDGLPAATTRSLLAESRTIDLEIGQVLADAGELVARIVFPTTAIVLVTAQVRGHEPLEIGMIGFEGMLGATLGLGVERHPLRAIIQGRGVALEIPADSFRRQLNHSKALNGAVHGYLFVLAEQLAQTAACNAFHKVSARLARWLLMMDDRARGEPLELTHLFLSRMLGVRRSAVTIAAGQLQEQETIRYARGNIQVLSRPGLEAAACECYPSAQAAYRRQFGPDQSA